jgi:ferritin
MFSEKIQQVLNKQLNCEFSSAYTYLSLAAYFEDLDLNGFAHWMKTQYQEELLHAERIYTYINDRDGRVSLQALEAPRSEWDSPLDAFKCALEGERALSEMIYGVVDEALQERDHATHTFMQWFVNEQVEEEAVVRDIISDMERIIESRDGLFLMDRDLAGRKPQAGQESTA